jgi:hypothetical protein
MELQIMLEAEHGKRSGASTWSHSEWFGTRAAGQRHPVLDKALSAAEDSRIDKHPFFVRASRSTAALRLWITQEMHVTGPFSQLLLQVAASIRNVHIRAMVVDVAYGEHGRMNGVVAEQAHPWLLDKLRRRAGIPTDDVVELPETAAFLEELHRECSGSPTRAVGALGVGNERLVVWEYSAVKKAFMNAWPGVGAEEFLDANIEEDSRHSALMLDAADGLINSSHDADEFYEGASSAVASRLRYYDALDERLARLPDRTG